MTLMLSSMAMFLEFDNSEDAFFPDNETVRLLDEVESEYQASIDFVRIIVRSDTGLSEPSTWSNLGAWSPFSWATKTCPLTHTHCLEVSRTTARLAQPYPG